MAEAARRLSPSRKRLAREGLQTLIKRASLKSEIFEEAADYFGANDERFDRVALSMKLLLNLLSAISDGAFSVIGPRSSGPWAPWAPWPSALASRIVSWTTPSLANGASKFLSDSLVAMGNEDARRHLHGQQYKFRPFPPSVSRGRRAAERLHRHFVDNR
jgi:hypothetical protein